MARDGPGPLPALLRSATLPQLTLGEGLMVLMVLMVRERQRATAVALGGLVPPPCEGERATERVHRWRTSAAPLPSGGRVGEGAVALTTTSQAKPVSFVCGRARFL